MGRRLDYGMFALANLGVSAVLKDVGHLMLPMAVADKSEDGLTESEAIEFRKHPDFGARILEKHGNFDAEVIETIRQHHEHWDGSGYPDGLKGGEISAFARILAIVDTFYDLVSARSDRPPFMPHEAIEFIMAYSGEWFDPEMVRVFARQVPLYPTGVMVKLNSKEIGIISDGNAGHVGRPIIRLCFDRDGDPVKKPYDIDLSDPEYQDRMVLQVLEY
jgi:HD-GYP domain-containing protein (c-di-GMP phosphodiesterase class II)